MSGVAEVIFVVLLGYFLVLNGLYFAITVGAFVTLRRQRALQYVELGRLARSATTLPVSVLVPAYNEETVLGQAIRSILASDYPELELIVVNDGSTDGTLVSATREFDLVACDVFHPAPIATQPIHTTYRSRRHPNLWLIDKENGGAADALNAGLNLARYPCVIHIDADCVVEPDSLMRLMRPINFAPGELVVAGAHLRLANGLHVDGGQIVGGSLPERLVERFQLIEYLSAFVLNRLGWAGLNSIPVISGGCGAWPKRLLLELGGFSTAVTHYDIEATIHAHAALRSSGTPYRIVSVPDAVVYTQVPTTWRDLLSQRKRWQRVAYEMLREYRRLILNPRYGYFGLIGMPYLLLFEGIGPFVEVFSFAFVIVLAVAGELSVGSLALYLVFSYGLIALIRIVSLFADVLYFRAYPKRSIATLTLLALAEPIFHVAQLPHRMLGFIEFLRGRRTHEPMTREPFTQRSPTPSAATTGP
ncbi:MAG TPA: glycosyltransferase [Solirubrobacteraceae bacterium]|nr:glycosyltransferase [Solirubrobacteraceae bacterium]